MKNPEKVGFRDYVVLIRDSKLTALVAVVMFAAMFVIAYAAASIVRGNTVHAYVAPRPTVELVKMFACQQYESGYHRIEKCAIDLEGKANAWLQEKQPGIRIIHRKFSTNKYSAFLVIFYEVREWRTKQPKPPAEKP